MGSRDARTTSGHGDQTYISNRTSETAMLTFRRDFPAPQSVESSFMVNRQWVTTAIFSTHTFPAFDNSFETVETSFASVRCASPNPLSRPRSRSHVVLLPSHDPSAFDFPPSRGQRFGLGVLSH